MIKKIRMIAAALLLAGFVFAPIGGPAAAQAYDFFKPCNDSGSTGSTVCQDKNQTQSTTDNSIYGPNGIINKIANIIAIIVGVVAIIVIIVAGIQYMLSTGDPTKVNNAKNAILYALVGLVVAFLARTLVVFIIQKLGK